MRLNLKQRWSGTAILITSLVMGISLVVSFSAGTWITDFTTSRWLATSLTEGHDAAMELTVEALGATGHRLAGELGSRSTPELARDLVQRSLAGTPFRRHFAVFPADPAAGPLTDVEECRDALAGAAAAGGWSGARYLGCGERSVLAVYAPASHPAVRGLALMLDLDAEYADWFARIGNAESLLFVGHRLAASTFRGAQGERLPAGLAEEDLAMADASSEPVLMRQPLVSPAGYRGFRMSADTLMDIRPGDPWFAGARRLTPPGERSVILVMAVPAKFTTFPVVATVAITGAIALLLLAVMAVITWKLVGRFSGPMEALLVSARAVMAGDLTVEVPIPDRREMHDLCETYNHMRTSIRDLISQRATLAREAGMAEIATGVLHNIGNVLNSVTVAAGVLKETIQNSQLGALQRVAALLNDPGGDLARTLRADPRGRQLAAFIAELSQLAQDERARQIGELTALSESVDHIKQIVATQQSYARGGGFIERCRLDQLAQDALRLEAPSVKGHQVEVAAHLEPAWIEADPHRVLQILVNLITNAIQAMDERRSGRQLVLRTFQVEGEAVLMVEDSGPGIAPENLPRLFTQGFTTKASGHGFGLHNSGLAAAEMGGTLRGENRGDQPGARFTLTLPVAGGSAAGRRAA